METTFFLKSLSLFHCVPRGGSRGVALVAFATPFISFFFFFFFCRSTMTTERLSGLALKINRSELLQKTPSRMRELVINYIPEELNYFFY